ncbi:TonB-dependent receptor [Rhodocytophaga rosea]|uniref:TonB-dependent receptor n=1 Tax=Rhodocytophaga rosea TaxID=2704465 RepID=A0A6C0GFV7_9BACT|nr:TonB-dependent receptor [Rhodocytophaga rosea]QHT66673.1 TonB-dependent receptor [Rhodocytophaga rosea]
MRTFTKYLLLLVITFLVLHQVQAQIPAAGKGKGKITGKVIDATNQEAVPFATAALTDPATGKPIDGAVADDNGKFTILKVSEGTYKIVISFIGYQDKVVDNVKISDKKDAVDLGTIKVSPSVQELKEVTVEAQKTLFEEKVDRTVYNAENDATNKGGDATDVLRKVPMLSVDLDGNVSLRGSQNLTVLINNRPSTIAASSIADALKQIPSDMIKSVEVITSPSAKYDAEGSGGIINIITKKNTLEGFSLNINSGVGIRGSNLGLNGNYRRGKMGFSLGGFGRAGYNVRGNFENNQLTYQYNENDGTLVENSLNRQMADTRNNNLFGRYQLGWDYDINKQNYISASVQFGTRNQRSYQDNLLTESTQLQTGTFSSRLQDVDTKDLSNNVDVNLNYTHNFKKPQQELSIQGQYSRNNRTNDFVRSTLDEDGFSILERAKNLNDSYNQESTIQVDYITPIAKNQILELGGKNIMRQVTSNFRYLSATGADGEYLPTPNRASDIFNYDQNVTAGYFTYTFNFLKNYSLKAGSRYEYTTITAQFQSDGEEIKIPSYGTLVPSVYISRKLKNGNMLKASYNRRIQRPSLQFLNPNVQNPNPLFESFGNPQLDPEFTNNFELGYNTYIKKTSLSMSAFVRNTTGAIQSIRRPKIGQEEVIQTTYENIGSENAYGLNVNANVSISNKFSLNGGGDIYYAVLDNNIADFLYAAHNEGIVYNIRGFANYSLTKGWGLQMFGFYRGRQVNLQGIQGGFGVYSLNIRKEFNEKKGSIGFGAENFFTTSIRVPNTVESPLINQKSINTMRNMNFKINFSYTIGKMSMDGGSRRRSRSINNDDVKEGGDNGGQNDGGGMQGGGGQGGGQRQGGGQAPTQGVRPQGQGQRQQQDSTLVKPDQQQFPGQGQDSTGVKQEPAQLQQQDSTQVNPAQKQFPTGQKPQTTPANQGQLVVPAGTPKKD